MTSYYVIIYVFFINNNTGWVAGSNGTILKTFSGGLINIEISNSNLPEDLSLSQNYPNPFNPVTRLEFGISNQEFVTLKIYDALGKEVKTLVNENKPAGNYSVEFNGSHLPSGIYFYKVIAESEKGNFVSTKKMTLIK